MKTPRAGAIALRMRSELRLQLAPVAALIALVVGLSAPLAHHLLGRRALRDQARAIAEQVATRVGRDAQDRPALWRYDTLRILDHLRSYEVQPDVERVVVVDGSGRPIDAEDDLRRWRPRDVLWGSAPMRIRGGEGGAVWVAVSVAALQRDSVLLLLVFGLLGSGLGGLMYRLSLHAIGRAEDRAEQLFERLQESQAALATLNEELEHKVQRRSEELRRAYAALQQVSARAVQLQESERRSLARDLHDSAGQFLTAIRLQLQLLTQRLDDDPQRELFTLAQRTLALVDDTVEDIRRVVNQLAPAVLHDVGLRVAVTRMLEDLAERSGLEVACSVSLRAPLDPSIEVTCYRLIQESLTNVVRHARASRVEVRLEDVARPSGVHLEIEDDGVGLEGTLESGDHRGLLGMRERVELLGGELHIESAPTLGTRVRVWLPALSTLDFAP